MSIVNDFFKTDLGREILKEAMEKKALDKDQYYDKSQQGPTRDEVKVAHPGGGEDTKVSTPGGGGEGVYEIKQTPIKATHPQADEHVETIVEQQKVDLQVALKAPTGKQGGTEIKGLAKKAEEKKEEEPKAEEKKEEEKEVEAACKMTKKDEKKKKSKKAFLERLAEIATKLDEKGLKDEADLIDAIIKEEAE